VFGNVIVISSAKAEFLIKIPYTTPVAKLEKVNELFMSVAILK